MNEVAIFGAGCFWGVEAAFKAQKGVVKTVVGYSGGSTDEPKYDDVCSGRTGHVEAIEIIFDPKVISYERLLGVFWQIHDPTLTNQQGPDVGTQYQAIIFYGDQRQKRAAEASKEGLASSGRFDTIATLIKPAGRFWPAEEEHQQYLEKHPGGYCQINLSAIH